MGGGSFSSTDYKRGVDQLHATGQTFARSATATATGNFRANMADILNPRKLKDGRRESCFVAGFNDATPIIISIDGTGSMDQVPVDIQRELPGIIDMLVKQGVSDHPNIMFMCHDDERAMPPDAVFQMSQFEIGAKELTEALNEMIIPGNGGGNQGEAYHLPFYAAAKHTRLECFERDGTKGFFFILCDEEPFYEAGDPSKNGTSPSIAKECFGDTLEAEVTMLQSVKEVCERYHVFVVRPGHTHHGQNQAITKMWQKLLKAAGEDPEHVIEVKETKDIIPAIALAIGRLTGVDDEGMVDVLKANGIDVAGAAHATKAIVPFASRANLVATGKSTGDIVTADKPSGGRSRR